KGAAEESFDCVLCGLCANRCPAQISQFTAAMFVRRLYGRYLVPKAEHLKKRVAEVRDEKYSKVLDSLSSLKPDELRKLYVDREREPDMSEPGKWMPNDKSNL
ncbi:MAG: 4Fe-4S ferredoxin, partial [Deltaproteobacteria bacterium]|nr:4Fe-4S ferredoxin [Deltaproteobacteria bacterium]